MIIVIIMLAKGHCIHGNVAVEIFRSSVREDQGKPALRRNDKQVVPHVLNGPAESVETFQFDGLALERVQMSPESWPLFGVGAATAGSSEQTVATTPNRASATCRSARPCKLFPLRFMADFPLPGAMDIAFDPGVY